MGYIIVLVLGVVIAGVLAVLLVTQSRNSQQGRLPEPHPVAVNQPAADEPTPAASKIAPAAQAQNAQRHTPAA